jgi:hypothetical protein
MFPCAEFHPAQRKLIDERPPAAAGLHRLARATEVARPHGVDEGNETGQFLPGGVLGQVLGDRGGHVPATERGIREDGVGDQERIARIGAERAFEIVGGLPVVAIAHGEARGQIGTGKAGAVLRRRGGGAAAIPADRQGRKHGERLNQSNERHMLG